MHEKPLFGLHCALSVINIWRCLCGACPARALLTPSLVSLLHLVAVAVVVAVVVRQQDIFHVCIVSMHVCLCFFN